MNELDNLLAVFQNKQQEAMDKQMKMIPTEVLPLLAQVFKEISETMTKELEFRKLKERLKA